MSRLGYGGHGGCFRLGCIAYIDPVACNSLTDVSIFPLCFLASWAICRNISDRLAKTDS